MQASDHHTVLVVEDEAPLRALVSDILREEGYRVEEARDGVQALDALAAPRQDAVCAVVLDMMLPRLDGVSVLRQLRRRRPGVPVVAMSASREHLAAAVTEGARGAVPKPFDIDQLVDAVNRSCAPRCEAHGRGTSAPPRR